MLYAVLVLFVALGAFTGLLAVISLAACLAKWLGAEDSLDSVMPFVIIAAVCSALSSGLFYVGVAIYRHLRRPQADGDTDAELPESSMPCAECGVHRLVRGPVKRRWFAASYTACCLNCGVRFGISCEEWKGLPWPRCDEPVMSPSELAQVNVHRPLTPGQILLFSILIVVVASCTTLDRKLGMVASPLLSAPFIWRLGQRLRGMRRAKRPRCTSCGATLPPECPSACPVCGAPVPVR